MAIAAEANCVVVHKPYDWNKGIAGVGSTSTRSRPDNHRAYYFGREIERWAEYRDAPVVAGMPAHHWNDMTLANCLIIAAGARGAAADAVAHAMEYRKYKRGPQSIPIQVPYERSNSAR